MCRIPRRSRPFCAWRGTMNTSRYDPKSETDELARKKITITGWVGVEGGVVELETLGLTGFEVLDAIQAGFAVRNWRRCDDCGIYKPKTAFDYAVSDHTDVQCLRCEYADVMSSRLE